MQKVLFYPYDYQSNIYMRFPELLGNIEEIVLMSFPGSGMIGKDASIVDKSKNSNIPIICDTEWESVVEQVTAVYFLNSAFEIDIEKQILPKIINVLEKNKKVFCDIPLEQEYVDQIMVHTNMDNDFQYYFSEIIDVSSEIDISLTSEIHKFTTPIVMVMGLTERTNKRIAQLSLKRDLEESGYSVSCILSSGNGERFGAHSYPLWMFDEGMGEASKIVAFNKYIKDIEKKEAPDLIVIGVPGSIFPYNNHFTNYFGIQAFLVTRAVEPDGIICCSNYIEFTKEFFEHVKKTISITFSTKVLGFALNNMIYDSRTTMQNSLKYSSIDNRIIIDVISRLDCKDIPLWSIIDDNDMKKMSENIINNFSVANNVLLV